MTGATSIRWTLRSNDASIARRAGRVLSRYVVPTALLDEADDDAIWIITADLTDSDSTTTILWPSDYVRHEAL